KRPRCRHIRPDLAAKGREATAEGGVVGPTRAGSDGPSTGHIEKRPLIAYVSGQAPESEMPPSAVRDRFRALSPDEVALLRAWIDQGAEWPAGLLVTPPRIEKQR